MKLEDKLEESRAWLIMIRKWSPFEITAEFYEYKLYILECCFLELKSKTLHSLIIAQIKSLNLFLRSTADGNLWYKVGTAKSKSYLRENNKKNALFLYLTPGILLLIIIIELRVRDRLLFYTLNKIAFISFFETIF